MGYDLPLSEIPQHTDLVDETRRAMTVYARRGLPQTPDRELAPGPGVPSPFGPNWFERLTPEEARRLADAINRS